MLSDRIRQNMFYDGGQTGTGLLNPNISAQEFWSRMGVNSQLNNPLGNQAASNQFLTNYGGKSDAISNPWSFKQSFSSEGLKAGLKAGAGAAIGAGANLVGGIAESAIGGGLHSGAGDAIGSIGGSLGSAVGAVNPVLGAAIGVGSKIIGGLTNRAFGTAVDEAKLQAAKSGTSQLNNFVSNASSFDAIEGPQAIAKVQDAYRGGWFSSSKAIRKNEELKRARKEAELWAKRGVENNVFNLQNTQMSDLLANYHAYGGGLDMPQAYALGVGTDNSNNMGAIGYGFMSDYLNSKRKQAEQKNNMGNMFAGMPSSMFAFGGDMQTNSADFPTGLTHIKAGGQHEENPNQGVQMGIDSEGVPNLVEEGETVYEDYVFSNRILADEATKKLFHLPKKKDITFADISKKLEREIQERPNDVISKAGFKAQMQTLEEQQERQKQEMEAERAKAAFEALSPEEQTALMQKKAEEEAMAQEAAQIVAGGQQPTEPTAEEVAMAGGAQSGAQPSPEEIAMMQQQVPTVDTMGVGASPQMAEGGRLFKKGGYKWSDFAKRMAAYKASLTKGNTSNHYKPDESFDYGQFKDIAALEASQDYTDFTDYVVKHKDDPEVQEYLKGLDSGTYQGVEKLFDGEKLKDNWETLYRTRRGDQKAGIYHLNPLMGETLFVEDTPAATSTVQEPKVYHALEGDDDYIQGELDPNVVGDEVRRVVLPKNAGTVIYHARKNATGDTADAGADEKDIEPVRKSDWMRYTGLFGPAVGLGMMAAGIGKPDYSDLDAAVERSGRAHLATYKPLGNYLTYRPMDIWYEQNRMDANSRATDRAILNNTSPSRMAGLLANGYNSQLAAGDLYRKALEYNDAKRAQVAEFNRGTDQFNADAFNRLSQFNASALNDAESRSLNARLHAAQQKLTNNAGWYNSLYGNVSGLFKGLSDLGRENRETNWRNALVTAGAFGAMDEDALVKAGIAKYKKGMQSSEGGTVKRKKGKRGLTC